jgi:hypothetical protein
VSQEELRIGCYCAGASGRQRCVGDAIMKVQIIKKSTVKTKKQSCACDWMIDEALISKK